VSAVIAALGAAGVPSEQARSVVANWLLGPNEEIADADDMDRLMIAADAPRILRVLLEARLAEFGSAVGFPSRYQTYGDGAPVHCAIHIDDVLAILAPVAGERVA